jgi:uncharacterized protein (DUF697 family)
MASDNFGKALLVVQTAATTAAGTAAALAQAPGADEVALTAVTTGMAWGIAKIYDMKATGEGVAAFIAVAFGATFGTRLATKLISWFPLIGNAANATSTFMLHQFTGFALIGFCELCHQEGKQPDISEFNSSRLEEYIKIVKDWH